MRTPKRNNPTTYSWTKLLKKDPNYCQNWYIRFLEVQFCISDSLDFIQKKTIFFKKNKSWLMLSQRCFQANYVSKERQQKSIPICCFLFNRNFERNHFFTTASSSLHCKTGPTPQLLVICRKEYRFFSHFLKWTFCFFFFVFSFLDSRKRKLLAKETTQK